MLLIELVTLFPVPPNFTTCKSTCILLKVSLSGICKSPATQTKTF